MRRVSIEEIDRRLELWERLGLHVETQCRYALGNRFRGPARGRLVERFGWPVQEDLCDD